MEKLTLEKVRQEVSHSSSKSNNLSSFKVFKVLWSYLKESKKYYYLGLLFAILNSLAYTSGSILIGQILHLYFEPYINGAVPIFQWTQFLIFLSCLALMFILYGIFKYLEALFYVKASFIAATNLRLKIMHKLYKMPIKYYDSQKAGDLISSLINDVNNVGNSLFQITSQIFSSCFNIVFSGIFLCLISFKLSLIVIPLTLVLFFSVFLIIQKAQKYFTQTQNTFGLLNAFVEESLNNTMVTNSFNQQKFVFSNLKKITKTIRQIAFKGDTIARSFETWYNLISNLIILIISGIAAIFYINKVSMWGLPFFGSSESGIATPSLIITYVSLNWNFMGPFQNLLSLAFNVQVGIASSKRVHRLTELKEPDLSKEKYTLDREVEGEIIFKNVFFKYNENLENWQLNDASFKVKQGQTIAIVGPTGAGKTTIINLLSKMYDYNKGSILIDGYELNEIKTENLRDNMTVILQDSFLFNETIRYNLKIANPNISDEQMIAAAKLTNAHHFIETMENGYDTVIENNGNNISQGQRQLIAITRAVLSNRNIVILDEATSNIDSQTEIIIQKAMLELMKNRTSFIIAHRLSTIKNADKILVIDAGKIIEEGTHEELLAQKGFYESLYSAQFK
ncbi:ABC transporter ATP-binding protein [Mycoplasmopsis gallinacea]|uniref:ATP-binding cassette domain-containing protein n=1 Tax=Mycoplasmopsis gallinacea TaxID=29556 RepID=A0A6H0V368_9BACT|nr:ABC transporter ATP-binding protein [Mycoplasmopsis gallinacea]QIW62428.1 ATP-binding cassette domain-containing protein [Mycoplasmopsis gallinacea]